MEKVRVPPVSQSGANEKTLRVVAIGGGTGLSTLLRGRQREDFKMLPPGDIRNCMVALSEDEHLLSKLFQFRFDQGELQGHSFGNLFVAALSHITGDFAQAVQMSSQILATRGNIFPATNTNVTLAAMMADGPLGRGEHKNTASKQRT